MGIILNNIEYTELLLLYLECGYTFTCKGGKLPILQLPNKDTVLYMREVGYTSLSVDNLDSNIPTPLE